MSVSNIWYHDKDYPSICFVIARKQVMIRNNNIEFLGHNGSEFIRYYGKVIFDEDEDKSLLKKAFEKMPMLEKTYGADSDLKPAIFHISKATAEIRNAAGIIESYDFLD